MKSGLLNKKALLNKRILLNNLDINIVKPRTSSLVDIGDQVLGKFMGVQPVARGPHAA